MTDRTAHPDGISDSATAAPGRRKLPRLLLVLVVCTIAWGLYWRVHFFDDPFIHAHLGHGASHIATFVRNLYRYGPIATRLGSVENQGQASPDQFRFAPNHPPLTHLYYAPLWAVSPGSEWTLRATALIFVLISWFVLLRLARRSRLRPFGLVMIGLGAVLPMGTYYDVHVDVQGPDILALSLLMLLAYVRWTERPTTRRWLLVLTFFGLGCMSEWPAYYMAAALITDLLLMRPGRHPIRAALSLAIAAVALFSLYSAYVAVLQGSVSPFEGLRRLVHGASRRSTLALPDAIREAGPLGPELFWHYLRGTMHNVLRLFTITALVLSGLALVNLAARACRRVLTMDDRLLLILVLFGSLHVVLFAGGAAIHDYWWKYLLPAVTWASARAILQIVPWLLGHLARGIAGPHRAWLVGTASGAVLVLIAIPAATETIEMYGITDPTTWERGVASAEATAPDEVVLAPDLRADPVLQYYMDREFVPRVSTPAKLAEALHEYGSRAALVTIQQRDLRRPELAPLLEALARYPHFDRHGHRFYRLRDDDGKR